MKKFSDFSGLSTHVLTALAQMKFETPTPIQEQAIPLALEGRDILGSAQTGTGKTGAFSIPMVSKLLNNEIQGALILTPTRELAAQVMVAINSFLGKNSGINAALLIGGEDIRRQLQQLRRNPRIIVGTPGRINDHIERGTIQLSKVNFVVLDETDRMLDMGFGQQIDSIIAEVAPERQTLMFSATMPNNIMKMASKYLKNPERIAIGSCLQPVAAIDQQSIKLVEEQKYDHLIKELTVREGSVVIFVKTKFGAKKIADKLYRDQFKAQAIHGNLRQNKRDQVIQGFKNKKFRVLVATDVAARGLDVPHVAHVINHDLPQCPEDYIHRIGRTARAGASGAAVNFITPQDNRLWRAIERFINLAVADKVVDALAVVIAVVAVNALVAEILSLVDVTKLVTLLMELHQIFMKSHVAVIMMVVAILNLADVTAQKALLKVAAVIVQKVLLKAVAVIMAVVITIEVLLENVQVIIALAEEIDLNLTLVQIAE